MEHYRAGEGQNLVSVIGHVHLDEVEREKSHRLFMDFLAKTGMIKDGESSENESNTTKS